MAEGAPLASDVAAIADGIGETAKQFSGQTVLISGGRGFLGRYFTAAFARMNETLLERPAKVIVLDNLITAGAAGAGGDDGSHEYHRHDIIQPFRYDQPIGFILHMAGIASPYYYRKYPLETLEVATTGTKNMLELAREHRARFLFFSSSEIYGDPDPRHVPTPESYRGNVSCLGPRACYDESKRLGETLSRIYHDHYGVETKIVRPFNVYGPGMQETDYRVLPNFASRIVGNRPLHVYGSGNQTRTFCYVTDAIVGFLLTLVDGIPGEAYNIGNSRPEVSMLDLVGCIEHVLGRPVAVEKIEYPDSYPADEPIRRCPDLTKARLQLGFEPKVELPDGLARFFGWARTAYTGKE
jgi:UDP-glucuronate decarboxylase